jgi:hypothetical protein
MPLFRLILTSKTEPTHAHAVMDEAEHSDGSDPVEGYDCFPRRPQTVHDVLNNSISLLDRLRFCCRYTVLCSVTQTHERHVSGIHQEANPNRNPDGGQDEVSQQAGPRPFLSAPG